MKPCEALSFSTTWFTKGLISGGLICSQYHLVAKECKNKQKYYRQRCKVQGSEIKVLP